MEEFGGEPQYTNFGIISKTICHNEPNPSNSNKLYYYTANDMFYCFTECGSLDIWALIIKVAKIQWSKEFNLNDAVRWTANHFGLSGSIIEDDELKTLADWKVLEEYERVQEVRPQVKQVILKEYDSSILNNFNYNVALGPWIDDGISPTSMKNAKIGYYPGGD